MEEIVVTGSYLRGRATQSPNPVQVISAEDIRKTSAVSLGEYLARLPVVGSAGTPNTRTSGGGGVSCTDLRNLGQSRVLVLIDGKRTTSNPIAECVDLNMIPVEGIERIEILKDGGSQLYGADAISGVINIRLRHDLNQGHITLKGGITQYGDNRAGLVSAYRGWNFVDGRGNLTLFGQYDDSGPILSRDRAWARRPQNNNPAQGAASFGSSIILAGSAIDPLTGRRVVRTQDGGLRPYAAADAYNFGDDFTILNAHRNGALSGDAHFDVAQALNLYATTRYSHSDLSRQYSPMPLQGSTPPSPLPLGWMLPAESPDNPWGRDAAISRRMGMVGPRRNDYAADTLTTIAGARGTLPYGWHYDASMTWGASQVAFDTSNMINYRRVLEQNGIRQRDPTNSRSPVTYDPSVCDPARGCTLQDPIGPYTPQASDYIRFTRHDNARYDLRDFNFRLHDNTLARLPIPHGGTVGVALGMEHREERLSYRPDPLVVAGDAAGVSGSSTDGGLQVSEGYGELRSSLLHGLPTIQDLTLDLQGRLSAYNSFGMARTWKIGARWAVSQDLALRATIGTSYRQPGIYSLYGGRTLGYPTAFDPCGRATAYGARAATVTARCQNAGVNTATFVPSLVGQLPAISGGNPDLRPESSRTLTAGAVLTPRFLPRFTLSAEYWRYSIGDLIAAQGAQTVLDGCYTGSTPSACALIAPRSAAGQITSISTVEQNIGRLRTSGVDIDLAYRIALDGQDSLVLAAHHQHLLEYRQQFSPGGAWTELSGRLLYLTGEGRPIDRNYATATFNHGPYSLSYMLQSTSGMKWNDGTRDLDRRTAGRVRSPSTFLQDVTLSADFGRWQCEGGLNNLFNRKPPFVADGLTNTALSQYAAFMPGRTIFLQLGVNF